MSLQTEAWDAQQRALATRIAKWAGCFGQTVQLLGPCASLGRHGYYWVHNERNTFRVHQIYLSEKAVSG